MEATNNSGRLEALKLLTVKENDLVLYDTLRADNLTKFFYLVKQGYPLSAFILNVMVDFGYERHLIKILDTSVRVHFNVYDFLCAHWGQKQAEDFLVDRAFSHLIKEKFSADSLVKYQCWDILAEKSEYRLLLEQGKSDVIKKHYVQNPSCRSEIINALVDISSDSPYRQQIMDFCVDVGEFERLSRIYGGVSRLLELKKWEYIPYRYLEDKTLYDVLQLVYKGGGRQFLCDVSWNCESPYYRIFRKFLLDNKYYDSFVANKSWGILSAYKAYDVIDWEDYVNGGTCSRYVWEHAAAAGKWELLARYRKHRLLFKNGQFGWWLKSLIYRLKGRE